MISVCNTGARITDMAHAKVIALRTRVGEEKPWAVKPAGTVIALGNFDGVHRGHRFLLETAKERAARRGVEAGAFTFSPHPRLFFDPVGCFLLGSEEQRQAAISELNLDYLIVQPFNRAFASLTAAEFLERILVRVCRAHELVVGEDFCCGSGREADAERLVQLAASKGVAVTIVRRLHDTSGDDYSSTNVRSAIGRGEMTLAAEMLCRFWRVSGRPRSTTGYWQLPFGNLVRPPAGRYPVRITVESASGVPYAKIDAFASVEPATMQHRDALIVASVPVAEGSAVHVDFVGPRSG